MVRPSLFRPWPCENSERVYTEGNRVLPAAVFRTVLPFPARILEAGEGNRSTCACPLKRFYTAKTQTDIARLSNLRCGKCFSAGVRHLILWHPRRSGGIA